MLVFLNCRGPLIGCGWHGYSLVSIIFLTGLFLNKIIFFCLKFFLSVVVERWRASYAEFYNIPTQSLLLLGHTHQHSHILLLLYIMSATQKAAYSLSC